MAQIVDRRQLGDLILQDFRKLNPEYLATACAARVEDRDELGRWIVSGRHSKSQGLLNDGLGHIASAILWPGANQNNLAAAHLASAAAITAQPIPSAPIIKQGSAPTRPRGGGVNTRKALLDDVSDRGWKVSGLYARVDATVYEGSVAVPKEWPGIVSRGSSTTSQELLFQAQQVPLISANRAGGDPNMSSRVHEILPSGEIDLARAAPLHSAWRVVRTRFGCATQTEATLSWQLGPSRDGTSGYGMCSQNSDTHAQFSWLRTGPLHPGPDDSHQLGTDEDGNGVYVGGLYTGAIYRGDGFDMPLQFDTTIYEQASAAGFWSMTVLRPDPETIHSWACGANFGMRRWETKVPYYMPEARDAPTPPGEEIFLRDPRVPPLPRDPPLVGDPFRQPPLIETVPGRSRIAGGELFSAFATAQGAVDTTRGHSYPRDVIDLMSNAPDVAILVAHATGTGSWGGFRYSEQPRKTADRNIRGIAESGGVSLLPPQFGLPDKLAEILAGDYDPTAGAKVWDGIRARLVIPGGLASIDFAHPVRDTLILAKNPTGAGTRMRQSSEGLEFVTLDGDGVESTNSLRVAEAGPKFVSSAGSLVLDGITLPTAARSQQFQDASGIIALLADIGQGVVDININPASTGYATTGSGAGARGSGAGSFGPMMYVALAAGFDQTVDFGGIKMPDNYSGGSVRVNVHWASSVGNTGDVRINVAWASLTGVDIDVYTVTAALTPIVETTSVISGIMKKSTFTFTAAQTGVAAGDIFVIRIIRLGTHATDTMSDDMQVFNVEIVEL